MSLVTVDLNPESEKHNAKQRKFFDDVMRVVSRSQKMEILRRKVEEFTGPEEELESLSKEFEEIKEVVKTDSRYFFYGGAVSGGKTIIALTILVFLCKIYPNSRWHVIRKSMPDLERTAKESLGFILRNSSGIQWKRTKSDYYCLFPNGSRIYFMAEGFDRDKDLDRFKGLMTNGFLLEQAEELQYDLFQKAIERAGRWFGVKVMPPPIILATFNPTFGWLKKRIHDNYRQGTLKAPYYYLQALPDDNPWNTEEQWSSWQNLDPETYARFIKGEWDIKISNQFFHSFNKEKNVSPEDIEIDWRQDLWLSFDFNVDPMTCIIGQSDGRSWLKVIHEFREPNSDTYALCERIKPFIYGMEHLVKITGDASGSNRMSGARGHINQYQIIQSELGLSNDQFFVPSVNPLLADSRVFMNSLLFRLPEFKIGPYCEHLLNDLMFVETELNRNGEITIKKTGINPNLQIDNKEIGHLSDCLRYFAHIVLYDWFRWGK